MSLLKHSTTLKYEPGIGKIRSYGEIVDFLDGRKNMEYSEASLKRMRELDKIFDNITSKIDIILVGGTNGKSSTINFASKLFKTEGFKVGAAYSSHVLTYNERIAINSLNIQNKQFSEVLNEVINAVELQKIEATTFEIMTIAALLFFKLEGVEVALLEVGMGGMYDATNICNPKIAAITRIANDHADVLSEDLDKIALEMLGIAKKDSWFISAEQSKIRLQKMKDWIDERGSKWAMPIRKLAMLPYIFEQLYGRSASLAERITQIYVEEIKKKFSPFLRGNLLATQKGQRGRPSLEAKRQAELNPIKTLKGFWSDEFELLRGRFELLDKEKPTILLDTAHNIDALNNVFLGIRLLHYQRSIKGLALIMGISKEINSNDVIKLIRYLFKKITGQVYFVPLTNESNYYNPEELANLAKDLNFKAKSCASFSEAFELSKKNVDERQGIVAICGHQSLITEYWKLKGIKKLN